VIGRNAVNPSFAWHGLIDEVGLYSRALTAAEIQATANPTRHYTQTAGATVLSGGTLAVGGGVQIQGGNLNGTGTVIGPVVNAAQVQPGDTANSPADGVLTVQGDYTQTAAGALNVQIEGKAAGAQYDQLNVTGTASLDGALHVLRP